MIEIDKVAFIFICILAGIGALIIALILLYIIAGILDITYHQRHRSSGTKHDCPDYVESEEDNDEKIR